MILIYIILSILVIDGIVDIQTGRKIDKLQNRIKILEGDE